MIRDIGKPIFAGLLAIVVLACNRPGVTEQQREEQAKERVTRARDEASQRTQSAQAAADKDIAAARADFDKDREDYRHARMADLVDLDGKISDLEAKERAAKDRAKSDLQATLSTIRAKRHAFVRDLHALDSAGPADWDREKAQLAQEWDGLKSAVDKAP
jgi:hypothetical protein